MPYGYIDNGAEVEINPANAFSTPKLKVAADEAAHYGASAGEVISQTIQHPAGSLALMSDADLDRYQIQRFAEPAVPAGKVVATRALVVTNGAISVSATFAPAPPAPVPDQIDRAQAKLELLATASPTNAGKTCYDDVLATISGLTDPALKAKVQIYFDDEPTWHRQHATLLALAGQMGWSSDFVDALFRNAPAQS